MFVAGTALHLAGSGRLIIRAKMEMRPGTIICDAKGRRIAKVIELFGPVNAPYVSATPLGDRFKRILKHQVYVLRRGEKVVETRG